MFFSVQHSCKSKQNQGKLQSTVPSMTSFDIKGVNYGFLPRGAQPTDGAQIKNPDVRLPNPFTDTNNNQIKTYRDLYDLDARLMGEKGINTVRTYSKIPMEKNGCEILGIFKKYNIKVIIGLNSYTETFASAQNYASSVSSCINRSAVLTYEVGNEWNYNFLYVPGHDQLDPLDLYNDKTLNLLYQTMEKMSQVIDGIKSGDQNATISSVMVGVYSKDYFDGFFHEYMGRKGAGSLISNKIDLLGFNLYPGNTTESMNTMIKTMAEGLKNFGIAKPIYISEYGIDAFNGRKGGEDQKMQNDSLKNLMKAVHCNSNVVGGSVFAWADEWWKAGAPDNHDVSDLGWGETLGQPDGKSHEEWYGIVTSERKPRMAYEMLSYNSGCN